MTMPSLQLHSQVSLYFKAIMQVVSDFSEQFSLWKKVNQLLEDAIEMPKMADTKFSCKVLENCKATMSSTTVTAVEEKAANHRRKQEKEAAAGKSKAVAAASAAAAALAAASVAGTAAAATAAGLFIMMVSNFVGSI